MAGIEEPGKGQKTIPENQATERQEMWADTLWDINGALAKCSPETPRTEVQEKLVAIEKIATEVGSAPSNNVAMEMYVALQYAETWNMVECVPRTKAIAESLREEKSE